MRFHVNGFNYFNKIANVGAQVQGIANAVTANSAVRMSPLVNTFDTGALQVIPKKEFT